MGLMDALRNFLGVEATVPRDERPPAMIATAAREAAAAALEAGNWRGASVAANKLYRDGGEARTPEPWLLYAASATLNNRPVSGVSSLDVGLRNWVEDPADRSILLWARAAMTHNRLRDPKSALLDYDAAGQACPDWLRSQLAADRKACAAKARAKRTMEPEVGQAPTYDPSADQEAVAPPLPGIIPGTKPSIFDEVAVILTRPFEGERGPQYVEHFDELAVPDELADLREPGWEDGEQPGDGSAPSGVHPNDDPDGDPDRRQ